MSVTSWTRETVSSTVASTGTSNFLYMNFGVGNGSNTNYPANTHIALPVVGMVQTSAQIDEPRLGTGTDPNLSLTTANISNQKASDFVPCMWYIHDDIIIEAVASIEGADNPTGDTTRFHLVSYDFTSGSTSCLTNGVILANNSDTTNEGVEQAYLSTWTVNSSEVSAGKVILATFRQDGTNSDYSVNVIVKYRLK